MNELKVSDAIDEIFILLRRSNKYIDETQSWVLGKDISKKERLGTVLYNLLESIRIAAVLLEPFLPETSQKILKQLNTEKNDWESLQNFNGIVHGDKVETAEILFARIDISQKMKEINKINEVKLFAENDKPKKEELEKEVIDELITIDDFSKVELRVAEVIKVEKHPSADKLLVFQLKVGDETRQVIS